MPKKLILRKKPTVANPVYEEQSPKKIRLVRKIEGETIKIFKNPRKLNTHFKSEVPIEDLLIWAAEEPEDEEVEEENEYIYEEPNMEDMDDEEQDTYRGKNTAMAKIGKKPLVRDEALDQWLREKNYDTIADKIDEVYMGGDQSFYVDKGGRYFHEMDLAHNKNITDPLILNAMKFWTKHNKTTNKFLKYEDIKDEYEYWD